MGRFSLQKSDPMVTLEGTPVDFVKCELETDDDYYAENLPLVDRNWEDDDSKPLSAIKTEPTSTISKKTKTRKKEVDQKLIKLGLVKCTTCKAHVPRPKLRVHMLGHTGPTFLCDVCGKSFSWRLTLVNHKRIHTGEKPHVCSFPNCGKAFRSSGRLSEHSSVHSNRRPYVCEVCGYSTRTSQGLKRHARVHTGEKPYVCTFESCQRAFAKSYNMYQHMKLHTGEQSKHSCSLCPAQFNRQNMLKDHVARNHPLSLTCSMSNEVPDKHPEASTIV